MLSFTQVSHCSQLQQKQAFKKLLWAAKETAEQRKWTGTVNRFRTLYIWKENYIHAAEDA